MERFLKKMAVSVNILGVTLSIQAALVVFRIEGKKYMHCLQTLLPGII